ncbi:MAG: tetratricopeptide repeat protein [Bacteroidia bacterium]|nr:tetratricopeptide repeat protein [Bacteroidia bacterium]
MYWYGILLLVIEIIFIIHAAFHRRLIWLVLIVLFPLVSCIIYAILFFILGVKFTTHIESSFLSEENRQKSSKRINELKQELDFSDTISHRQALAEEYMKISNYSEAVQLYKSCLTGIFKDDSYLLFELAKALFYNMCYNEAKEVLSKLVSLYPIFHSDEVTFFLARSYEEAGETEHALNTYKKILRSYPGEEARCRYATLLMKNGNTGEAGNLFRKIIDDAKSATNSYKTEQKKWLDIAANYLKDLGISE